MIAFIRGLLFHKGENHVVVDCNGVGYHVRTSQFTLHELPDSGTVFLHTYFHVIENDQQLFGFASPDERAAFEQLITVNGIGPKMALSILSGISYVQLVEIILKKQSGLLTKVPGIGKKTAERIILELSDRLKKLEAAPGLQPATGASAPQNDTASELIAGLQALGYKRPQAEAAALRVMGDLPGEKNLSTLVRAALRVLNS
jgi:Holliday junction DNA helicase RuvA